MGRGGGGGGGGGGGSRGSRVPVWSGHTHWWEHNTLGGYVEGVIATFTHQRNHALLGQFGQFGKFIIMIVCPAAVLSFLS